MLGTKNEKRIFQEKIVHMYLSIIKEENHLNENFWNEFFLLKANGGYLEQELLKHTHQDDENDGKTNEYNRKWFEFFFADNDPQQSLEQFIDSICALLFNDQILPGVKSIALKLLSIYATSSTKIDDNFFIKNFMTYQLFDALIDSLNFLQNQQDELLILLLLTIFSNYNKPITNPFMVKLSIVDDEIILNKYSASIMIELIEFNAKFDELITDSKTGLLSSISSMTSSKLLENNYDNDGMQENTLHQHPPANLIVALLEFFSNVMLGIKENVAQETIRICFLILTSITEDACANSIIHDRSIAFVVHLKRLPMRHRKLSIEKTKGLSPICSSVLDLMIEFIFANLNRHTKDESLLFCLGIIHRLLCFQKRSQIRIQYDWKELWSALIILIKFLLNYETLLLKNNFNLFEVSYKIISIFNMFILYGDNFLHNDICYDELYYEIIRMNSVFNNLNTFALRYLAKENSNNSISSTNSNSINYKEVSAKLINSLLNIKAIIAHLNSKLELYSMQNKLITLSEDQVLEIVRSNYDFLTLKLPENLDSYESYNFIRTEEIDFLHKILQSIIHEFVLSKRFVVSFEEQQILMQKIQLISSINSGQSAGSVPSDEGEEDARNYIDDEIPIGSLTIGESRDFNKGDA
ncbi:hypothetical protein SSS_01812 [Sarcoptes scabiei]|uniref:Armadillo-like helical domain-containing protein n=2 Tax=Sarcoptes scabiei TaxID=52283 RepID=A0A834VB55_SARSC|nr:hypothetical protein SSS_01812 [Sarcoptes scabiei]